MKLNNCLKVAAAAVAFSVPYSAQAALLDGTFSPDFDADIYVIAGRYQWDPAANSGVGDFVNVESAVVGAGFTMNQVTDDISDNGVLDGTYVGTAAAEATIASLFGNAGSVDGVADEFFYTAMAAQKDPNFVRRGYVSTKNNPADPGPAAEDNFSRMDQFATTISTLPGDINPSLDASNASIFADSTYDNFSGDLRNMFELELGQSALMTWNGVIGQGLEEVDLGTFFVGTDGNIELASATSAVPVPAAVWLFGSGVVGLVGVARRRKA